MDLDWGAVAAFIFNHWDQIILVLTALIGFIKSTKWGSANAKALETVTEAIEAIDNEELKKLVEYKVASKGRQVKDVLDDAVAKADVKKLSPKKRSILKRELTRIRHK